MCGQIFIRYKTCVFPLPVFLTSFIYPREEFLFGHQRRVRLLFLGQ